MSRDNVFIAYCHPQTILSATPASQIDYTQQHNAAWLKLLPDMACPTCRSNASSLLIQDSLLECSACGVTFPLYISGEACIPWLFESPNLSLLEWKARLNGFLHINEVEQQRLKAALKDKRLSKAAQKRITKIFKAKQTHTAQVLDLIAPLELEQENFDNQIDPTQALYAKVPKVQGLLSYYDNIFRDWTWDNGENEQLLAAVESVLNEPRDLGKVLTLGAGTGRLSYDIHKKFSPKLSVLLDINPVLLFAGNRAIQGDNISLYEFPIAPLDENSFATLQKCQAPEAIKENILYLFADGMNPPFQAHSLDTVLTPWLIDIVPQNLRDFIPRINQILKKGGRWVNTGSLAFLHSDQTWCYSEKEVLDLLEKNGFEIVASNRKEIQYLNSPISANGRTEKVFNFCVKKIKDAMVPPKYNYLPNWVLDTNKSIPKHNQYEIEASRYLLQAQVIGAIDGSRSIEQIGTLVAKQYGLQINEATHAVRRIVIDLYEGNIC